MVQESESRMPCLRLRVEAFRVQHLGSSVWGGDLCSVPIKSSFTEIYFEIEASYMSSGHCPLQDFRNSGGGCPGGSLPWTSSCEKKARQNFRDQRGERTRDPHLYIVPDHRAEDIRPAHPRQHIHPRHRPFHFLLGHTLGWSPNDHPKRLARHPLRRLQAPYPARARPHPAVERPPSLRSTWRVGKVDGWHPVRAVPRRLLGPQAVLQFDSTRHRVKSVYPDSIKS